MRMCYFVFEQENLLGFIMVRAFGGGGQVV